MAPLLLCLVLSGCGLMHAGVPAGGESDPAQAAVPQRTPDAEAADRLVALWRSQGLKAEARYEQVPARPVDRIEWKALSVVLAADAEQMDAVMASVGQFAARATQPVVIQLYARNRKQDGVLSQALKKGALASGGRNSVKLEHNIRPDFTPRVELKVREGTQ